MPPLQVLTEVYAARPLPLPEYVCVSLVLNKIVDPQREVRDAARGLLSMMSRRVWGRDPRYSEQHETAEGPSAAAAAAGLAGVHRAPAGADGTVVVGSLANSYAAYQLRLSARLAKEHTALRCEGWLPVWRGRAC